MNQAKVHGIIILLVLCLKHISAFYGMFRPHNTHEEPVIELVDQTKALEKSPEIYKKYINQKLDNFDQNNKLEWKQLYMQNSEFYQRGGPIFIYVGGEWPITPISLARGHMYDMAKELKGIMFYIEHRFYGKSRPTTDTSSANLQYLSAQQALADLANFIRVIKTDKDLATSGVILLGASYSATLATWARLKYPELVNGVWASSGPLYAKVDFKEYYEVVTESIRQVGGEKCINRINTAFRQLESYFAFSEPKYLVKIMKDFNLCEPIKLCRDTAFFFEEIPDAFAGLVQSHRYDSIQKACDFITQEKFTDDVEAVGAWYKDQKKDEPCVDMNYDNTVRKFRNITWDSEANKQMRQWIYQTCESFAWFITSSSSNQVFSAKHPTIGFYVQLCRDLYDNGFDEYSIGENVKRINMQFGGYVPKVTNVYSVHGQLDPWHTMGARSDLDSSSPTVLLYNYSHVPDLSSISPKDSQQMKKSKLQIKELVKKWLNLQK